MNSQFVVFGLMAVITGWISPKLTTAIQPTISKTETGLLGPLNADGTQPFRNQIVIAFFTGAISLIGFYIAIEVLKALKLNPELPKL